VTDSLSLSDTPLLLDRLEAVYESLVKDSSLARQSDFKALCIEQYLMLKDYQTTLNKLTLPSIDKIRVLNSAT
jgi:hypothetical protein